MPSGVTLSDLKTATGYVTFIINQNRYTHTSILSERNLQNYFRYQL